MILVGRPLRTFLATPASAAIADWYLPLSLASNAWWEAAGNGSDITVYAQNHTTRLPCSLVAFNATAKTGHLFIGRGTATACYVECGSGRAAQAVTDPYGRNAVWEAGALGAWHLADKTDSTGKSTSTSTSEPGYTAANLITNPALFAVASSNYINTGCATDGLTDFSVLSWITPATGTVFPWSSRNNGTTGGIMCVCQSKVGIGFSSGANYVYRRAENYVLGTPSRSIATHAAGVADLVLYKDGTLLSGAATTLQHTATIPTDPANSSTSFTFGRDGAGSTPYYFTDTIGHTRLYNRVLSGTECLALDANLRTPATFWTIGACF